MTLTLRGKNAKGSLLNSIKRLRAPANLKYLDSASYCDVITVSIPSLQVPEYGRLLM
jgi:hypothetical protein